MQEDLEATSNLDTPLPVDAASKTKGLATKKKLQPLDIVEIVSVVGSIGGTIASAVTQQVVFASLPLSLAMTLNLVNRRKQLDAMNDRNQEAITQITQKNDVTDNRVNLLEEELAEAKQIAANLGQATNMLQDYIQSLRKEQIKLSKLVGLLKEIETYDQLIRSKPNYAEAYYNKGLNHQALGEREGAICDYSDAIRIDPSHAQAYYNRGLLLAEIGDKKGAVEDLREAAKLFFDRGDIASYQKARDLSKNLHELKVIAKENDPAEALSVPVEDLFS